MTEQEVRRYLRQIKEEDSERAFRKFYEMTYDRLFRIAWYFLRNDEASQEVVLDVFVKLWENRAALPELDSIEDYCFIAVKNAALNYVAKQRREAALHSEEWDEASVVPHHSAEEEVIGEEIFAKYVKALDRLPSRCREVFLKIREEQKSYAEVAEEMGISVKTVDAQLQAALQKLRRMLLEEK